MTPAQFKIRFPQFSSIEDSRIQYFINESDPWFNRSAWGGFYEQGVALWIAHQLTVEAMMTGAAESGNLDVGSITDRISVGDVSIGSKQSGGSNSSDNMERFYSSTSFGIQYYQLSQMVGIGGVAV